MPHTPHLVLGSILGALAIVGALSIGERALVRTASADATAACRDWEVQIWEPLTAAQRPNPNTYLAPHFDPSPSAAPSGWEPFGVMNKQYALRRCTAF